MSGLGHAAARGGVITMLGQVVRILVQLLGLVVLARLLSPRDYGLMAMMLVIIAIAEVFRDFGLTQAAVQAPTLSTAQRNNLFWLNTAMGGALSLVVFLGAPLIAEIFGSPEITDLARWTSVIFLINGMSTQYRASLNREMRFGALAAVDVGASAAGLISAIAAALLGMGYWSLAIQQLVFAPVALIIAAVCSRWIPGRVNKSGDIRPLVMYGTNLLGVQLISNLYRNIDTFILGTRFGAAVTGYYDRAFQVLMLPLNQLNAPATKVALPTLSKLNGEPKKFGIFLVTGQSLMVQALFAIFAFVGAATEPLVLIALGDQWAPSVLILKILCIGGCAQAASYASYWVFLARGLTRQNLHYALATRPLMMLLIVFGSGWGAHGVAFAYSLGLLLSWPVAIAWLNQCTDIPARRMLSNGLLGFLSWGSVWALTSLADVLLRELNPVLRLCGDAGAFVLAVLLMCLILPVFRRRIIELATLLRGGVRAIRRSQA